MIEASFKTEGGYELRLRGHAGYQSGRGDEPRTSVLPAGKTLMPGGFSPPEQIKCWGCPTRPDEWGNIVCAGVSAVVYALAGALQNEPGHVSRLETELESGDARVYCEGDEVAGALFGMAEVGLLQIEKAHPKYIKVER